jgi:glycosyltransferase involved in cell wall biosynthesis
MFRPATRWHERRVRALERSIFASADLVIANTPENADHYARRFGVSSSQCVVIPNGFDRADVPEPSLASRANTFRIGYAGGLDKHGFPWRLALEAIEALANEVGRQRVRLVLCGFLSQSAREFIEQHRMTDIVELHGSLPHQDAMRLTSATHIRLLLLYENEYSGSIVPMKLYNYLVMRGPIVAVAPEVGATADIIRRTRTGTVISPARGLQPVVDSLRQHFQSWESGTLRFEPDEMEIRRYDRREQCAILAAHLKNGAHD